MIQFQISTLMTYFLVFITIYLKYEAVKNVNKQNYRKVVIILMLLLPIFITMVRTELIKSFLYVLIKVAQIDLMIVFFSPNEAQKKFNELNAIITDHSVIGYVISGRISSFLLTVIIFGSVFLLPPAGFFIRKYVFQKIVIKISCSEKLFDALTQLLIQHQLAKNFNVEVLLMYEHVSNTVY